MRAKRPFLLAVGVVSVLGLCGAAGLAEASVDITVDGNQTYQEVKGFGTCFGYWINEPYSWDSFRQMYAQDLGASIIRIELGPWVLFQSGSLCYEGHCGHNSTVSDLFAEYYFTESLDDNVAVLDPKAQFVGTPFGVLVNACEQYKLDELMVVGSFWTPAHYLKTSTGPDSTYRKSKKGKSSIGGHIIADDYYYTQLGRYVCAWVEAWNRYWGVPVSAVSLQNEPFFEVGYNSCFYYSSYGPTLGGPPVAEFPGPVKAVGAERAANGMAFKFQAPEGILYDNGWADGLDRTFGWIQDIRDDPDACAAIDGWVIHGYHPRARESCRSQRQRYQWDRYYNGVFGEGDVLPNYWDGIVTDGKVGWNFQTEDGSQQSAWTGYDEYYGHNGALGMSTQIHEALVVAHQNAWIYWQTADSTSGVANEHCLTTGTDTTQPKYKAFKHFSRYIRPGSVRVDASPEMVAGVDEAVLTSAYVKEATDQVVIEVLNIDTSAHTLNITLSNLPAVDSFDAYRSTETENHASVGPYAVSGGVVSFTAPAESIVTLVSAAANTAPVANDDAYSTQVDQTLNVPAPGVLENDTDGENDPLTAVKKSEPSHGSVTLNSDGSFTYTPDTGYEGQDSFTYVANDGELDSNIATVTVTVSAEPTTCHVDSITVEWIEAGGPNRKGQATVVIKDDAGGPVSDATVSGTFSGTLSESASGTTDSTGTAVIQTVAKTQNPGALTFCVDDVTHATLTYNSDDNVETCDSV